MQTCFFFFLKGISFDVAHWILKPALPFSALFKTKRALKFPSGSDSRILPAPCNSQCSSGIPIIWTAFASSNHLFNFEPTGYLKKNKLNRRGITVVLLVSYITSVCTLCWSERQRFSRVLFQNYRGCALDNLNFATKQPYPLHKLKFNWIKEIFYFEC